MENTSCCLPCYTTIAYCFHLVSCDLCFQSYSKHTRVFAHTKGENREAKTREKLNIFVVADDVDWRKPDA